MLWKHVQSLKVQGKLYNLTVVGTYSVWHYFTETHETSRKYAILFINIAIEHRTDGLSKILCNNNLTSLLELCAPLTNPFPS